MIEDFLDHHRIFDARDHLDRTPTVLAGQDVDLEIRTVASPARVDIREGFSLPELARLVVEKPQQFDFISIDASHQAPDVLGDAVLAFQLLRVGGVMAFDDYLWSPTPQGTENPILLPKMAIDAFTTAYSRRLRILSGLPLYQLYIQRTA
jgi:predicted O-methyltransferase YrrM